MGQREELASDVPKHTNSAHALRASNTGWANGCMLRLQVFTHMSYPDTPTQDSERSHSIGSMRFRLRKKCVFGIRFVFVSTYCVGT